MFFQTCIPLLTFPFMIALIPPARFTRLIFILHLTSISACLFLVPLLILFPLSSSSFLSHHLFSSPIISHQGLPVTAAERSSLFNGQSGALYNIGGELFSPDDIEHGVLRGNTPHPSQIEKDKSRSSYMNVWDKRAILALPYLDPR